MSVLYLLVCLLAQLSRSADTLKLIQVLYRHGSRYQIYNNWDWEPYAEVKGYLTPVGMRQHYVLGTYLRKKYITDTPLLSPSMVETEFKLTSTDVNRTIESSQSNLFGLYPLGTGPNIPDVTEDKWKPPIAGIEVPAGLNQEALPQNYQPIPTHVNLEKSDTILQGYSPVIIIDEYCKRGPCPNKYEVEEENKKTDLYYQVQNHSLPMLQQLADELGISADTLDIGVAADYYDTFLCHIYTDGVLPERLTQSTLDQLSKIYMLAYNLIIFQTWEQQRIYSTPFFANLLDEINNSLNGVTAYKSVFYSAHDMLILMSLNALNLTSTECLADFYVNGTQSDDCVTTYPGFASSLIFELWQRDDKSYFMKLLYNDKYQKICSGKYECDLEEFQTTLTNQFGDFDSYCGIGTYTNKTESWVYYVIGALAVLALLSIGLLVYCILQVNKQAKFKTSIQHEQSDN